MDHRKPPVRVRESPAPRRSERGMMLPAGAAVVLLAGIVYAVLEMAHRV